MSLPPLTVIPAGAGSGKTYTIETTLGDWVEHGKISADRIVAVTFTEAAASELRERIRGRLLKLGRYADALKLDAAYISTIHSFGLRLLTEYALDTGFSPIPRLLNEHEQNILVRLALARTEEADEIATNLQRYGYKFDFSSQKSPEDNFKDDILRTVALFRSIGWTHRNNNYADYAVGWIRDRYGNVVEASKLTESLQKYVQKLLDRFPENLAREYGKNATAKKEFNRDFQNLHRA